MNSLTFFFLKRTELLILLVSSSQKYLLKMKGPVPLPLSPVYFYKIYSFSDFFIKLYFDTESKKIW